MSSRIGAGEWKIVYATAAMVDAVQVFIGFFVIGVAINAIADIFIGIGIIIYFQMRGVSMLRHPSRLFSLLGVGLLEEFTGGFAPAWVVDIWYIHRTVKQEDAQSANVIQPKFPTGFTPPRNQRVPVNREPGIRQPNNK